MYKTAVYQGEELLGQVVIYPQLLHNNVDELLKKDIRITQFSQSSERCPPIAVLHTISSNGICFKLESQSQQQQDNSLLNQLHSSCIRDNKTAVMQLGAEEIHLVAMSSRSNERQCPCFWGFNVAPGLYNSCLVMLNLRCLGIVFDLDETLIVANTMRSFEDRIEGLQRKINSEVDPQRIAGILAEIKRYQDDKSILKQYAENDQVVENGKIIRVQSEVVSALSESYPPIVRPLIRLQDRNIILTRINPQIRDTSVLVRLRPAWEDLRSYLTARGRKRFEVYVCTMAERDYALEMWRLLDPDANLINSNELLDRIVCVKSGSRKSLFNVFQNTLCHPKMAMVIDDRLKVWDDRDQPRVHVVPAFAPYHASQAEENNIIPVLCVARNVACNVRGGFFREFDDGLLQKIPELSYEDDIKDIPSPPDVSNYLVQEDDASGGNRDPLSFDGMADAEVERRLKDAISASSTVSSSANIDPRLASSLQFPMASSTPVQIPTAQLSMVTYPSMQLPQVAPVMKASVPVAPEPSLQHSPAREEGEVPESELDPDTRRRLLILQHGQDMRDLPPSEPPKFPVKPAMQASVPRVPSRGNWLPVEEEMTSRQLNRAPAREYPLDSEPMIIEKNRPSHLSFFPKVDASIPPDRMYHENQRFPKEVPQRDDRSRFNSLSSYHSFSGEEMPSSRSSSSSRDDFESGRAFSSAETPVEVLQDIAVKCGTKVEFRPSLVASAELQFAIEAWFAGEKIGDGVGRTRKEALRLASEGSIKHLAIWNVFADIYMSRGKPDANDNGVLANLNLYSTCMMEGLGGVFFQEQPPTSANALQRNEVHAQVEVDGQIFGKGIGLTWDEAKTQAAEKALGTLKSMVGQYPSKRQGSPRSFQGMSNKRMKPDYQRVMQRMPPTGRFAKNAPTVVKSTSHCFFNRTQT
ncbi:LOW QUALITY PROTEIN: RNA polymerase II C-terminal domain phosphatase-like 1 [Rutidosis leptorrhynchoides]|uniref:LOW QUALITY PROTEIN: RNA polymerase II C-terminal domain phosphatase-like 1 n=1 Tax=Rutidosis leptorrhynchoides TaxID=125765 RepID=UPI003A98F7B2